MLTFPYDLTASGANKADAVEDVVEATTARTLVAADKSKLIRCTAATDVTITVDASVFEDADEIYFEQHGAGQIIFDGTAVLETSEDYQLKSASQHAIIGLRFDGDALANLFGDRELV